MNARNAFNVPFSMIQLEFDNAGLYNTAAEEVGTTFMSTELGGGGSDIARLFAIAKKGLRNYLNQTRI